MSSHPPSRAATALASYLARRVTPRRPRGYVGAPLPGGGEVRLRPLGHGESGPVEEVFDAMSVTAREQRYLVRLDRLPPTMLAALADVDGVRHVAWLAAVRGRPVGVARYVVEEPGVAEVALEVADGHRGAGIGAALLDAVTTVAAARGVHSIRAYVLPANEPSRRLMLGVGVRFEAVDGLLEGEGALRLIEPRRVDRSAVLELALRGGLDRRPDPLTTGAPAC